MVVNNVNHKDSPKRRLPLVFGPILKSHESGAPRCASEIENLHKETAHTGSSGWEVCFPHARQGIIADVRPRAQKVIIWGESSRREGWPGEERSELSAAACEMTLGKYSAWKPNKEAEMRREVSLAVVLFAAVFQRKFWSQLDKNEQKMENCANNKEDYRHMN